VGHFAKKLGSSLTPCSYRHIEDNIRLLEHLDRENKKLNKDIKTIVQEKKRTSEDRMQLELQVDDIVQAQKMKMKMKIMCP
jgi:hypothetical protein